MPSQEIKCRVDTCKYNKESCVCSLQDIVVGNTTDKAQNPHQTECASFELH